MSQCYYFEDYKGIRLHCALIYGHDGAHDLPKIIPQQVIAEAVEAMNKAAVRLSQYIQHTCSYSTSFGASSPDSDVCTCRMGSAVTEANEALAQLRAIAKGKIQ